MSAHTLRVQILTFWHSGTGLRIGAAVDAATCRDASGLPTLPGRHLKGLLRDGLERAEVWGWPGHTGRGLAGALFGTRAEHGRNDESPPPQSTVHVSDARLPEQLAQWLGHDTPEVRSLRAGLFRVVHSTAIDEETGTALDHTLRGIEVAVPLDLTANIEPVPGSLLPPADWPTRLREILPLISAVGAHRTRGLGRALLSLEG